MISSSCAVAWASVMSLCFIYAVGGRYTFMTLTRWLFGSITLVNSPYSFPIVYSIANYFFTYVTSPPRLPFLLLSSTMLYPGIVGGIAFFASHVSCTQSMSMSCCASITYSFKKVRPRMLILATVIPWVSHFFMFVFVLCFLLRDPFVLPIILFCCLPSLGYLLSMGGGMWLGRALAGPTPVLCMLWRVHSHVVALVVAGLLGCVSGSGLSSPSPICSPIFCEDWRVLALLDCW